MSLHEAWDFTHCNTFSWRFRSLPQWLERSCIRWTWNWRLGGRQIDFRLNGHVSIGKFWVMSRLLLFSLWPKSYSNEPSLMSPNRNSTSYVTQCCVEVKCKGLYVGSDASQETNELNSLTCWRTLGRPRDTWIRFSWGRFDPLCFCCCTEQ